MLVVVLRLLAVVDGVGLSVAAMEEEQEGEPTVVAVAVVAVVVAVVTPLVVPPLMQAVARDEGVLVDRIRLLCRPAAAAAAAPATILQQHRPGSRQATPHQTAQVSDVILLLWRRLCGIDDC